MSLKIDLSGKAAAKADGTVSERLAFLQQQQEDEFTKTFYVTKDEAASVGGFIYFFPKEMVFSCR